MAGWRRGIRERHLRWDPDYKKFQVDGKVRKGFDFHVWIGTVWFEK